MAASVHENIARRAALQRWLNPARFTWMMHSTRGVWQVSTKLFRRADHHLEFIEILELLSKKPLTNSHGVTMTVLPEMSDEGDSYLIRIDLFSPKLKFLDVLKVWIPKKLDPDSNTVDLAYYIESSGICPLIIPGAPFISCLLFWVPFTDDRQKTRREIEWLVYDFDEFSQLKSVITSKRGM